MHIGHDSNQIWLDRLVNVKAQLTPVSKASGCAVFALEPAADVEKGFHGVLSKSSKAVHLEKTPPPFEGRGEVVNYRYALVVPVIY